MFLKGPDNIALIRLITFVLFLNLGMLPAPHPSAAQNEYLHDDTRYVPSPPSYTKLGHGGKELPDGARHVDEDGLWIMTRDNVTGLIWELKTGTPGPRHNGNTYSWFDPNPDTNGGHEGTRNGGDCTGSPCDTHSYIEALNVKNFGGYFDWRLPNVRDLSTLLKSGDNQAVHMEWFPYVFSNRYYWSSMTCNGNSYGAWRVSMEGGVNKDFKSHSYYVIAVREGNLDIISPERGAVLPRGDVVTVTWETRNISGKVRLSLSRMAGAEETFEIISAAAENSGSFEWKVTGPGSAWCVLRIEPLSNPSRGQSFGYFIIPFTLKYRAGENGSIKGNEVQIVEPGGEGAPVEAVPKEGYRFLKWSDSLRDNPRIDVNVQRDLDVEAIFAAEQS